MTSEPLLCLDMVQEAMTREPLCLDMVQEAMTSEPLFFCITHLPPLWVTEPLDHEVKGLTGAPVLVKSEAAIVDWIGLEDWYLES